MTATTVNVALPDTMGAFGIGQDRGQWIVTGNLAGQAVGQSLSAWPIDSFGQRKTFVVGLGAFAVSLLAAALAPNDLTLVGARVVQGLMAGVLQSAGALDFLGRMVYAQAYSLAFRDCFLIVTLVFMLALIPAWLMGSKAR